MEINGHFSVPILRHKVSDFLADDIEKFVLTKLDKLKEDKDQFNDFYVEEKVLDLKVDLPDLYQEILQCRDVFEQNTSILSSREKFQYWIQDYRTENHLHELHSHGVYGLSGIYWVRANNAAGQLCFKNPNILAHYQDTAPSNSPFAFKKVLYPPEKGIILFFPSYLEHEVLKGSNGIIRTTIAFNFGMKEHE